MASFLRVFGTDRFGSDRLAANASSPSGLRSLRASLFPLLAGNSNQPVYRDLESTSP